MNLKKLSKFLSLFYISFICFTLAGTDKADYLNSFKSDLKKYKPNAPWITESFMSMDLNQFNQTFKHIMEMLTNPKKRWFYFCNDPKEFEIDNHWADCLWQCIFYERWMNTVCIEDNRLIDKKWAEIKINIPFVKTLATIESLSLGENLINIYYQFYAFYIDCLSNFFCRAVYSCYSFLDDQKLYRLFLSTAKKSLAKMKSNLRIISKSKFYPSYKLTIDNYKDILMLLEEERVKAYLNSELN